VFDTRISVGVMDDDQIASPVEATIPTVRIVEPTLIKETDKGQEPTPTNSTLLPRNVLSSHRVLYRGSLSFPSSEIDIPLEGLYPDSLL
jgi:hypothetical protein